MESNADINGASQIIRVPRNVGNPFQELDIVTDEKTFSRLRTNGLLTHLMKANLRLAHVIRGTLAYTVPHDLSQ